MSEAPPITYGAYIVRPPRRAVGCGVVLLIVLAIPLPIFDLATLVQ